MGDVCVSEDMWSEVRIFENIAHTSIHNLRAGECFIQIRGRKTDSIINTDCSWLRKGSFTPLLRSSFLSFFFFNSTNYFKRIGNFYIQRSVPLLLINLSWFFILQLKFSLSVNYRRCFETRIMQQQFIFQQITGEKFNYTISTSFVKDNREGKATKIKWMSIEFWAFFFLCKLKNLSVILHFTLKSFCILSCTIYNNEISSVITIF